jgi:predicted CXXCH cytochrome family protein
MRRLLFLGLASALLISLGGVGAAQADNGPHVSRAGGVSVSNQIAGTVRCASCHRAPTAREEFPRSAGQDGLCFTCHGPGANGASTDVVDGLGYDVGGTQNRDRSTAPGALRGGGFDYALIGSGMATRDTYLSGASLLTRNQVIPVLAAGKATTSNHRVTGAKGTAWDDSALNSGAGAEVTLECDSCHDPHGNANYRILRPIPANSGGSTSAVGVRIPDANVKVYTTTNYWLTGDAAVPPVVNGVNVGTAVSDGYLGNIIQWCTTCHSRHHSGANDKMGERKCVTCHVAHGSNASLSGASSGHVKQPAGSAARGSSKLLRLDDRAPCTMCHNL